LVPLGSLVGLASGAAPASLLATTAGASGGGGSTLGAWASALASELVFATGAASPRSARGPEPSGSALGNAGLQATPTIRDKTTYRRTTALHHSESAAANHAERGSTGRAP
jgi:hypothetical protein